MSNDLQKQVPTLSEGVILQDVDSGTDGESEMVVVLPNRNQIKVVNEVGSFILRLIDGQRTVAEIVQTVQQTYAASPEQIEKDVLIYLEQLVQKEIVELTEGLSSSK